MDSDWRVLVDRRRFSNGSERCHYRNNNCFSDNVDQYHAVQRRVQCLEQLPERALLRS